MPVSMNSINRCARKTLTVQGFKGSKVQGLVEPEIWSSFKLDAFQEGLILNAEPLTLERLVIHNEKDGPGLVP